MQMKISVTSTMFTNLTCKLSKCVCEFPDRMLSAYLSDVCVFCLSVYLIQHSAWVYIYPAHDASSKDPIDGPKDHLSITKYSKDQQGPRKITFRGLSFEAYLSMPSKDLQYPSIGYPSTQSIFQHIPTVVQVKPGDG
ncbi:hypothetical protein Hdeb2414_s0012g00394321 [Helianthus debilis subsp. tardiflorus]